MANLDRDNAFYNYQAPVVVDELTKKKSAQAAADAATAAAVAALNTPWAAPDPIVKDGKTQAQLDAAAGAADTVKLINENYPTQFKSTIDPKTGYVVTTDLKTNKIITNNPPPVVTKSDTSKPVISDATKDAFAMLTDLFNSYDLGELAGEIQGYMTSGLTAGEALIKLKTNPNGAYAQRFAGNFARQKSGLNMLSEADYLTLENSYAQTLKSYGLGDMLSTDKKANWKTFSDYIANDISAVEFKDRIDTVEKRVINADPATKDLFKQWYPSISDKDLVAYFLNPTQTIDKLKAKTTAAEIGSAFTGQGLTTNQSSAEGFAAYGIDRAGALTGAAQIAEVLPTSNKLSNIYGETGINYTQATGESEFLKTNQKAAEQRRQLKSLERAKFSGDSGTSQQFSSVNKSVQGAF
jgi:hypothetical protein